MSNKNSDFDIIAHRGDSDSAPENTWAAFDLALRQGFAGVETDCQLTEDGVCVIIHDELLDRTTNGAGPVAESTWEDVRGLDAGSWFNHRFTGERVPLAEDFLRRYRGRMHLHLELKSSQTGLAQAAAAALDRTGWLWDLRDRQRKSTFGAPGLTITSFHLSQLQESLKVVPEVRHGWLVQILDDEAVALAKSCGIRQICPRADALTPEAVKLARSQGLSVRVWGVKNTKVLLHVLNCGAEGATVNWPRRARDAVRMSASPWMWIRLPGRETRAVASAAGATLAAFVFLKFLSRTA